MASKQVALDLAAFLDSEEAHSLAEPASEDVRRITETFLRICYEDLGKEPRLLDDQDVHVALGHVLPGHLARNDPLAEHVPAVLGAFFDHLEKAKVVTQIYEIRQGLASTTAEFLETVRTGENAHRHAHKQDPFVHKAPKLGRNDPCFCGSGKKFKKCCGR